MTQVVQIETRPEWQRQLAQSFTTPEALGTFLQLPASFIAAHQQARTLFPLRVPRYFAELMSRGDTQDPLLRQIWPLVDEFNEVEGYTEDPLEEQSSTIPSLLHKYESRVLLVFRGGCAVNCRYCFRRHFPYETHRFGRQEQTQALTYIAKHPELNEVILSGGDPLMASDEHILNFAQQLTKIPHIKRLRIHSRLPVVLPARLRSELAAQITALGLQLVLVVHINHHREITPTLAQALQQWQCPGVTLLNQSVLLKGINDSAATLVEISETLFAAGVLPYYLHQLDKVQGAAHFAVSDNDALELHRQLRAQVAGFLVPELVREIAGEPNKTPI